MELNAKYYLGVDVAGSNNTWFTIIKQSNGKLHLLQPPDITSFNALLDIGNKLGGFHAIAIDAPLSEDVVSESGMRPSEKALRKELENGGNPNWIMSQNSMMAVPTRGRSIASLLALYSGTIIETHPTVCLHRTLGKIPSYKRASGSNDIYSLVLRWLDSINLIIDTEPDWFEKDGSLDSLVCACVSFLYIQSPDSLENLSLKDLSNSGVFKMRGQHPFIITK